MKRRCSWWKSAPRTILVVIEAVAIDGGVEELAGDKLASYILQDIVPLTGVLNLKGFHRPLLSVQVGLLATVIAN